MLKRILCVLATAGILSGEGRAEPTPAWQVPDPEALADDAFGQGRDLIVKTSSLIGIDAVDPAKRYGNGLDCQS
jgi:hypothetical protein